MKYKIIIGTEDVTEYVPIPLSDQFTLDESLDQAFLRLTYTDKSEAYRPFTNVDIYIYDDFGNVRELNFFSASDNKTEIIATNKFNHELLLIEQTKWFERFLTGTKTVTNPLVHDYLSASSAVYVNRTDYKVHLFETVEEYSGWYDENFKSIVTSGGEILLTSIKDWFLKNEGFRNLYSKLTVRRNKEEIFRTENINETYLLALDIKEGEKNAEYEIEYHTRANANYEDAGTKDVFVINVVKEFPTNKNKTITDVVNSLLLSIQTLRENESPLFTFNKEQAEKYSKVDAPEFTLTGTLWEALKQIGGFIHAIPRLKGTTVYFDELGSSKLTDVDLSEYISHTERFDIEQFASAIDSTIQNIVNLDDKEQGSIVAPFINGWKTPRTESGKVTLESTDVFFQTKEPIGEIINVEIGKIGDDDVGSIFPYIYEEAEYLGLSSYDDEYPYSKAYALKYKIGQPNVTGLSFKLPDAVSPNFKSYAIFNIIARKLGRDPSWIDNLFSNEDPREIPYRITYIPYTDIRARQLKPYTDELEFDSSLAYNQSAQKINSNAYGENMKGAIARLGNPEITKVYLFTDLSMIPKVGELFDENYYISVVKCEYFNTFVRCELGLSKNFNKLNEYVGISNEIRFYEISERQAQERHILYEDYCVVGDKKVLADDSLMTSNGVKRFADSFTEGQAKNRLPISLVKAQGYSDIDNPPEVAMAVTTFGIGNSLVFSYHYDDNYSAGETVKKKGETIIQNQVRYTDIYGELKTLRLQYGNVTEEKTTTAEQIEQGNRLPYTDELGEFEEFFGTGDNKIQINKDNREIPTITYQMHFVTNKKSIVIGSGLARTCTFTSTIEQNYKLYILPDRIPKFARLIDLTGATLVGGLEAVVDGEGFALYGVNGTNPVAIADGQSWVICQENELIVGENAQIKNGDDFVLPTFTFTHTLNPIIAVFDANGGTVDGEVNKVYSQRYNTNLNIPTDPIREGHIFGGWYTEDYADNALVDENKRVSTETIFTTADNGKVFYAYWTTESYNLTFAGEGVTVRRTKSPLGNLGYLASGDTIYYGDNLYIYAENTRRVRVTMGGITIVDSDTYEEKYGYNLTVKNYVDIEIETAQWETVLSDTSVGLPYRTENVQWQTTTDVSATQGTGLQKDPLSQIYIKGTVYYYYSDPNIYDGEQQYSYENFDLVTMLENEGGGLVEFIELTEYGIEIVGSESGIAKVTLKFSVPNNGVLRITHIGDGAINRFEKIYFEKIEQLN